MRSPASLALLLPLAVSAAPTSSNANAVLQELFCKVNVVVVSALKKDAAATSYCSSYLSIPTLTYTATATSTPASVYTTVPTTVTADAVTDTLTTTSTVTTDVTTTETSTEIVTETTTQTTSTATLTCLNSAYTASTPVGTILEKRSAAATKPTCIPTTWASAVVSTACSCLSIPTPSTTTTVTQTLVPGTITVTSTDTLTPTVTATETATSTATNTQTETVTTTSTTTLTAYAEATTIASNGIAYRKYTHSYNADSSSSGYTSSAFKSLTPDWSGVLQSLTFNTPNWSGGSQYLTLSDHSAFLATQAALLLQGFFIAKQTGTYTFSSSKDYIDNWGYLWTGDVAYSTWSDSNTNFQASRTGAGYYGGSYSVTLNAGDAIPLAWLWANGGGVSQSYFKLTSPDGTSTTDTSGFFVQACSSSVFA
ncbi:hypothetical protein PFICI_02426 [Pestalotiopsis fici W106-1]|uniref:PA14 domain-containing protein n=1 Tax=Pestalotiopsis fici (strain W106-1 / CGMCC3.15140) TaxID=1229662 RepID=W3XGQ9_PESFW|nr:uncharacterized protein PFICI_02426 [Pestalotiopsis fici W106-1]ETS84401.1 hypothetical protein PFICI_02426 [Pestalotiopsis fici W106-1]